MATTSESYSIILVNFKTKNLTSACLELIRQYLDLSRIPVIVVDNASDDDSLAYLKTLDWVRLIERTPEDNTEPAYQAHGRALDLGMKAVDTDYVLILHTDTLIHSPEIIQYLFSSIAKNPRIAAVGTVDQRNRSTFRRFWRLFRNTTRYCKAKFSQTIRGQDVIVKPIRDRNLKSFCCLWNVRLIRKHGLKFCMDNKNPGYGMQGKFQLLGYKLLRLPSRRIFSYLDHVQSGTVVETGQAKLTRRRSSAYEKLLRKEVTEVSA